MVVDAIGRTDMDLRKSLFGNIVLSGGSTLCKGFGDRLLNEVQRLAVKDMRIKIFAPPERKYSTWIGGSILAGLSTFRKVCLQPLAPSCRYFSPYHLLLLSSLFENVVLSAAIVGFSIRHEHRAISQNTPLEDPIS